MWRPPGPILPFSPSPLVGEGGEIERSEMEPDEGSASAERDLSPGFASRSHPLPQGASGCTHLLISDRRLRKTRVLSIVAAVPTCRHFQNRGSSKSLYLSRFSRCVHALAPTRGEGKHAGFNSPHQYSMARRFLISSTRLSSASNRA